MARRTHEQIAAEYAKEYDRIRKQLSRMEKRGYDVEGLRPERVAKKDIRAKDVNALRKLTNKKIYELARYQGESGAAKRKEEQKAAAEKGARTKYYKRKAREYAKKGSPRPEQWPPEPVKPPTAPPVGPIPEPGEDEALSDEEEAALQRWEEDVDKFNSDFAFAMHAWRDSVIARAGKKAFARMIADAYADGFYIPYQAAYNDTMCDDMKDYLLSYLPDGAMSQADRELTEDEWQNLVDESLENEDFPFF